MYEGLVEVWRIFNSIVVIWLMFILFIIVLCLISFFRSFDVVIIIIYELVLDILFENDLLIFFVRCMFEMVCRGL